MIGLPRAILVRHYAPFPLLLILGASCTNRDLPLGTTPNKPAFEIQDAPVTPAALFVANFTSNSITVYAAGATGNATPTATIAGSNTGLNGPVGIVFNAARQLYAANTRSNSITVYAAGATGNATPIATIAGSNTGLTASNGIAVDAVGRLYVANFDNVNITSSSITVYAAGATGNVTPITTIAGSNTGLNAPFGIALDAGGRLYVANLDSDSITVYAAGATGNATPTATIAGSNTGLSGPDGIALDAGGRLYVVNVLTNSITAYAAGATGNATPATTIAGSNTGLNNPIGIAVDAAGRLYVTNFNSGNFGIVIYAAGASGNATPTAIIAGSNTGLNFPTYLALQGATPAQAINTLIGQVISPSLGFSNGEKTSLTAKLQAALGYLQAGDTPDAIAVLQAFINQVNALVNSGRLTTAAAAPLISAAEGIIAEL